jgi:hypothetical protein
MTPWFPAAFRPTAFASWASCSRRGLRLPLRLVYGLVFCVRTSAWMMSLTSQILTFFARQHPPAAEPECDELPRLGVPRKTASSRPLDSRWPTYSMLRSYWQK